MVIADAIRFDLVPQDQSVAQTSARPNKSKSNSAKRDDLERDREDFFVALKKQYQPVWTDTPKLPWKTDPDHGIIKGRIVASDTGNPIYNSSILLASTDERLQRSEPHGVYAFFEVPPGSHTITAKAKGFAPATMQLEVRAGAVLEANLSLVPQPTSP